MHLTLRTGLVVSALLASLGCKGGSNSANSPVSPSNTTLLGAWTGTVTRPAGLAPFTVRWETGLDSFTLNGPLTLTSGGVSATTTAEGVVAGNDRNGYTIHMSFNSQGPGCTIRGATAGPQGGEPFPQPYRTISVPAFSISYVGCQALIGPAGLFLQETVQLNLTK